MTEPDKPNGLNNTSQEIFQLSDSDFGLLTLEVVPSVLTRITDEGTDSSRYYVLHMQLQQLSTKEEIKITVAIPEEFKDPVADAIKIEHFPNQPCTHSHEGCKHD